MRWLALVAACFAAACAHQAPVEPPAGGRQEIVEPILDEAHAALRANPGEQKRILALAQQAVRGGGLPSDRLRLGLLLASLPAPLRDEARAAELLQPLADSGDAAAAPLAALVLSSLEERQRLRRDRERVERERAAADRERDRREDALRQQLEALRSIERGILEREERLRGRPR